MGRKNRMSSKDTIIDYNCKGKQITEPFNIRNIVYDKDDIQFIYYKEIDTDRYDTIQLTDLSLKKIAEGSFGNILRGTSKKYPEVDFVIKENKSDDKLDEIRLLDEEPMFISCKKYLVNFKKIDNNMIIMPHITGDLSKVNNLNVKQIKSIIKILGEGLLCLAKNGIYYFDIKAENIFYNCMSDNTMSVFFGDLGSMLVNRDNEYATTFPPPMLLVKHMDRIESLTDQILELRSKNFTPSVGEKYQQLTDDVMYYKSERGYLHIRNVKNNYEKIYSWQLSVLALELLNFELLGQFSWIDFQHIDMLRRIIELGIQDNFGVKDDLEFMKNTLIIEPENRISLPELLEIL